MGDARGAIDRVAERFPDFVISRHDLLGDQTVVVRREGLVPVLTMLRDEPDLAFVMPVDVTCVDRLGLGEKPFHTTAPLSPGVLTLDPLPAVAPGHRFEVVYHLRSPLLRAVVRVKVPVEESDPAVPTSTGVFKGFNWFEREVFDMFGVRFEGHPDLRRILMYPEFVGHPLRKDYPRRGYQPLVDMPRLRGDPVPGARGPS